MRWTLDQADFIPLEESKLPTWRWTQESHRPFAPEQLAMIRALRPDVVERIHGAVWRGHAREMTDAGYNASAVCPADAQCLGADDAIDAVRDRLLDWVADDGQDVIVLWDKHVGAVVPWRVFCEYWDNFCYPSSDDNVIVPIEGSWFLWYHHEEQFWFLRNANGQ